MLDVMIDGKKKNVKIGKRVRFGDYEILVEKKYSEKFETFSEQNKKEFNRLKKELHNLIKGKQITINVGGPFYIHGKIELDNNSISDESFEMNLNNIKFVTKDSTTQGFVDFINDHDTFDEEFGFAPDYFEEYAEVSKFKTRIGNFVSECRELADTYGIDQNHFFKELYLTAFQE